MKINIKISDKNMSTANNSNEDRKETPRTEVDQREPWQKNPEFSFKTVALISLGFFTTSVWSFYDSQISLALEGMFSNLLLVGFIMTIDNIVGVILQPITGALSDRTKSRFGRRMPFVMIGLPISAAAFLCLGLSKGNPVLYILNILWFVTSMAFWRAPIVSLMPDFVHPKDRSKGNAIVNVLAGIGTAILSLVGGIIIDINYALAFEVLAVVMIIAFLILFFTIREPDTREWDFSKVKLGSEEKKPSLKEELTFIWNEEDKSMVWMMLAIFFWFIAYNTASSLISIYAKRYFEFSPGQASFLVTAVSVSFLLFAPFSVKMAGKIGRRKTIMVGLIIWAIGYLLGSIASGPSNVIFMWMTTILMGIGWSCINIHSITMCWAMAPDVKTVGVYTGLYYAASFSSQIIGPLTFGYIFEYVWGMRYMLIILSVLILLAFAAMSRVTRGEVELTEEEKKKRQEALSNMDLDD